MNDYRRLARETALRHGIDPDIFEAQIDQESRFNKNAVSSAGAQGLGQLMPGTAAELGVKNPWDPAQNLDGAARYLGRMLDQFGDYRKALAAYNAGPGTVTRAGGVPNIPETINYVDIVTKGAARLRARGGGQSRPPAALRTPSPPMTDGGTLRTTPTGSSVRSEMMDPFVSTAKAGLEPRDQGHALMAALFAELAERKGTSDFAPALREAIGPLNEIAALPKLWKRGAEAIFGAQRPVSTGAPTTEGMMPFAASQPAESQIGAMTRGDGSMNEQPTTARQPATGKGRRISLSTFGKALRNMGFKVAENRLLGTPVGGHSRGSLHYDDDAIDLTIQQGSPLLQRTYPFKKNPVDADWPQITQYWGEVLEKMFPQKQILHRGNEPGGHSEHIHFGMPGLKDGVTLTPEAEQLLAPYLAGG